MSDCLLSDNQRWPCGSTCLIGKSSTHERKLGDILPESTTDKYVQYDIMVPFTFHDSPQGRENYSVNYNGSIM